MTVACARSEVATVRSVPGQRSFLRRALVVVLGCYTLLHVAYSLHHYNIFSGQLSGDFRRVFKEAVEWKQTGILPLGNVLYPPLYYLLLLPFTQWNFPSVTYVFYFLQFPLYYAAILYLVNAVSPHRRPSAMEYFIAAVLTLNFQPFLETLAMHKVEGIEFFLMCLAFYTFRKRREILTGALVTLAANLKYLPGALAVSFVLKREWRVVRGMVLSLLVYMLLLTPIFRLGGVWDYVIRYPIILMFGHQHEGNRPEVGMEMQTLTGTVYRWFVGSAGMHEHFQTQNYVPVPHVHLAATIAMGLKILIGVWYLAFTQKAWKASERETPWIPHLLQLSLSLPLMFVFVQTSRVHYAILLLPAFVITALILYHAPRVFHWREKLVFALAYSLTAMAIPGGLLNRLPPSPVWDKHYSFAYLWLSLPFYGYLLLGLCIAWCHQRWYEADPKDTTR